jgi:DNA repair exonuclease SbcCD ATPase subunit
MSERMIKPPIITAEDADQLNSKLQNELAEHLFMFCHYRPIPENPQTLSARFVPGILNLYIFSTDACFYLKNFNGFLINKKIFRNEGVPSSIRSPAQKIRDIINRITRLRTAIAHNGTISNEEYYQNWIKNTLNNKYPATTLADFDKLEKKLKGIRHNLIQFINDLIVEIGKLDKEKSQIVDAWEEKTIEVFSRKHNGIYESQLRNAYFDKTNNEPKWCDLEEWIENSIGFRFQLQIDELSNKIKIIENDINKRSIYLKQIDDIIKSGEPADIQKWNNHKKSIQEEIDKLSNQKNEKEKIQNEQQEKLDELKSKVEKYESKTTFFYDHLTNQLTQTLKELKEEKEIKFTLFPETFIREDIERNFPPPKP